MKITQEQTAGLTADTSSTAANRPKKERPVTPQTSPQTPATPTTGRQTAVTFRRDTDGSVYYIVSDARTGDEILQVPPKAVRDAGQGIEEYLKNEESKATATARIAVKA
jgi:hypothetical protein